MSLHRGGSRIDKGGGGDFIFSGGSGGNLPPPPEKKSAFQSIFQPKYGRFFTWTAPPLFAWFATVLSLLLWEMQSRMKWNESGFRPPLCTYRLNWARRTSWGWWDDWDDTVLQTQDSKFESWRSEAEHATSRSRRLPTILTFTRGWGRNNFVSFKPPRPGTEPRDSGVKGSGANHYPRAPARKAERTTEPCL